MIEVKEIDIKLVQNNEGQIPGLPGNPRVHLRTRVEKLAKSIKEDPEFITLRPIIVFRYNGNYIAIGGNMRLKALKQLKYTKVPVIEIPQNTSVEKLKNFIVKDNASFGDWDTSALRDWDVFSLQNWNVSTDNFFTEPVEKKEEKSRKGWGGIGKSSAGTFNEKKCDMISRIQWHSINPVAYLSSFSTSDEGYPLSVIKSNDDNIKIFANAACELITKTISNGDWNSWCIITTPKRRHAEHNFSDLVCREVSNILQIKYHPDCVTAKNRQRINPEFMLAYPIEEPNIIVYDDIVTTGNTIKATCALFPKKHKLIIIGIHNK